jgi:hypothetical protein
VFVPFQEITLDPIRVLWEPQQGPQTDLVTCPVFEVFFGGARGGGKTEASLGDWLQHQAAYGVGAIGIFVRRELTQLNEVIERSIELFTPLGAKYHDQKKQWRFPNGARLKFVYLDKDKDAEKYQGHSYTRVYVEEVTNFPSPDPINKLRATLRSARGVPVGLRLTGNPGGPGHHWVKARYIDPNPRGYEIITETEEITIEGVVETVSLSRVFIPSKLRDNKLLLKNDPTYVLRLKQSGGPALVKAWLDGDWNAVEGAFFEFDPLRHIKPFDTLFRIPRTATRFRAFDWGSAKPFSVGWYAISDGTWGLPRHALLKYREWYGASKPNVGLKMSADAVAKGIIEREPSEPIKYGVADPSIFIQSGGPSIAEMMNIAGVAWRRADNKRVPGWNAVQTRLAGGPDGIPMLYFLETCHDSIRTLPTLQHDENDVEDLDTTQEDHAADELRYACMSRPWIPPMPVQAKHRHLTFANMLEMSRKSKLPQSYL